MRSDWKTYCFVTISGYFERLQEGAKFRKDSNGQTSSLGYGLVENTYENQPEEQAIHGFTHLSQSFRHGLGKKKKTCDPPSSGRRALLF